MSHEDVHTIWTFDRTKSEGLELDNSQILTVSQAVKQTGKSDKTIRRWIKNEKLKAEKDGRSYQIKNSDLERVTKLVSKEWRTGSEMAELRMEIDELRRDMTEVQKLIKKLLPKRTPAKRAKIG